MKAMNVGLLIRVGIDSSYGQWNAPCTMDGRFCYVPMGSEKPATNHDYNTYKPFVDHLITSAASVSTPHKACLWPRKLPRFGHFDPDFKWCTYGDGGGSNRGKRILKFQKQLSFVVFYAGLRDLDSGNLVYSIIGFYWVKRVQRVKDIKKADWHKNFHTDPQPEKSRINDVVIFGDTNHKLNGRLYKHIPIGIRRGKGKMWRVKKDLLKNWGGLDVNDGYLQRSAFLPKFEAPDRFLTWFRKQKPMTIRKNNLKYNSSK